jgi:hypothetical protein
MTMYNSYYFPKIYLTSGTLFDTLKTVYLFQYNVSDWLKQDTTQIFALREFIEKFATVLSKYQYIHFSGGTRSARSEWWSQEDGMDMAFSTHGREENA